MPKDILGTLIRRLVTVPAHMLGALADLAEKLAGSNGERWFAELKRFLRKEETWQDEDTFILTVDYSKSLVELISIYKVGKFDWVNSEVTRENFPHDSSRGTVEVGFKLFHFSRDISSEEVVAEMEKAGYKPADLPTLCAFGAKHPETQREFPVVALGSVWRRPDGRRVFPCLYRGRWYDGRSLDLYGLGSGWPARFRFLAVREVA